MSSQDPNEDPPLPSLQEVRPEIDSDDPSELNDQIEQIASTADPTILEALIDGVPEDARQLTRSFARWLGIRSSGDFLNSILSALNRRLPLVSQLADLESLDLPLMLEANGLLDALEATTAKPRFALCHSTSERTNDPTRGVQTDHPFYAMHPYRPPDTTNQAAYDQLQAQLILAAVRWWDEHADEYRHGAITLLDHASRGVRLLADSAIASKLPPNPMRQDEYAIALRLLIGTAVADGQDGSGDKTNQWLQAIINILEALARDDAKKYVELATMVDWVGPDDTNLPYGYSIRKSTTTIDAAEAKLVRHSGLAVDEVAADVEYVVFDPDPRTPMPDRPAQRPPKLTELIRVREHQITATERGNQCLPIAWNRLRPHEVARLLHEVAEEASDYTEQSRCWTSDPECVETAAALMTSFWTAHALADALNLDLIASKEDVDAHRSRKGLAFIIKERLWCLPGQRPKNPPKHEGWNRADAEPVSPVVFLPVSDEVAKFILKLPNIPLAMAQGKASGFSLDREHLRERATTVLRRADAFHPRRITRTRVEQHLFWSIAEQSRDLALASIAVGRPHRQADTALHYACFDQATIAETYAVTCARIVADSQLELDALGARKATDKDTVSSPSRPAVPPQIKEQTALGVSICPVPSTVQRLRHAVVNAFDRVKAHPGVPHFLMQHHNLLVLYTVLLLKMATGYRDIRSPLPRREDIDFADSTLLCTDKDDVASFSARTLPLVEPLRQQLIELDLHVRALASRLVQVSPNLANDLFRQYGLAPEPPPQKKSAKKPLPTEPTDDEAGKGAAPKKKKTPERAPPLFFLVLKNEKLKFDKVRPKTLKDALADHAPWFALPTNANRSYLRRQLQQPSSVRFTTPPADPEAVDYLMSHWVRGREPLGTFATRPLQHYLDSLAPRLAEILMRDGWTVIEGLQ